MRRRLLSSNIKAGYKTIIGINYGIAHTGETVAQLSGVTEDTQVLPQNTMSKPRWIVYSGGYYFIGCKYCIWRTVDFRSFTLIYGNNTNTNTIILGLAATPSGLVYAAVLAGGATSTARNTLVFTNNNGSNWTTAWQDSVTTSFYYNETMYSSSVQINGTYLCAVFHRSSTNSPVFIGWPLTGGHYTETVIPNVGTVSEFVGFNVNNSGQFVLSWRTNNSTTQVRHIITNNPSQIPAVQTGIYGWNGIIYHAGEYIFVGYNGSGYSITSSTNILGSAPKTYTGYLATSQKLALVSVTGYLCMLEYYSATSIRFLRLNSGLAFTVVDLGVATNHQNSYKTTIYQL